MRVGRWLSRALITFVAVAGVLAMHGLTMNHDAAMVSMSSSVPVEAPSVPLTPMTGTAAVSAPARSQTTVVSLGAALARGTSASRIGVLAPTGPMTTACLAFLAGLVLLFGSGRMLGRTRRDASTGPTRYDLAWLATAVDRLRPDLGELSVLRT